MHRSKALLVIFTLVSIQVVSANLHAQQPGSTAHLHQHATTAAAASAAGPQAEQQAVRSMTPGHQHMSAHMKYTALRPLATGDRERADALVKTLREALDRYKDYRVAIADGYQPFLPNLPLPQYHFTNYWNGFLEAFSFDPARPTSLLYKKTANGYELVGAMYTMPRRTSEEELNERVPLSIGRWHQHVNLCMPRRSRGARADWTKFGLMGSISTAETCQEAGGRFFPVVFGWMIHVYPFESTPADIWRP